MMLFFRVLVAAWALISVAFGVLAFFVVTGYGSSVSAAAYEGLETIPEALLIMMGFDGAPMAATVAYWLALIVAIFLTFRPTKRRA